MTLSLLGAYQPYNAAVVLTAVEVLGRYGVSISPKAVADGLSHAQWHGRFEVLRRNPYIIYDGAHNPDGVALAAESIRKAERLRTAIQGWFPGRTAGMCWTACGATSTRCR
jgi:dihydrofolate synthase/folylpolyglutamate synthase